MMTTRAWIGDKELAMEHLLEAGADRTPEGHFIFSGDAEKIILGLGEVEVVIPVNVVYFVKGERRNLVDELLKKGGICVHVI